MIDTEPTNPASEETDRFLQAASDTYQRSSSGPICVADGNGLSVRVDRGHLVVSDGLGPYRRERRYHKATHGLSRLVILGASGSLTLDALRYCDRLGIAVVVIDPGDHRPSFASIPRRIDDARLRRVQAAAPAGALGIDVARLLLGAKLQGQVDVLMRCLGDLEASESVKILLDCLDGCSSIDELRASEAAAASCYFTAWSTSQRTVPRFAARDRKGIPEHWLRYDGRRSRLGTVTGNRRAERPTNAILNTLFSLAEIEAVLACHALGIDPGLGIVHLDARSRSSSMALDLVEPIRPHIEAWSIDLLARRTFKRSDFSEDADGHVRVLSPLSHELADTMPIWRDLLAPWAEKVAHLLGQSVDGKYVATTPLTGRNARSAQASATARKARTNAYREQLATQDMAPRQKPGDPVIVPKDSCRECGGPLARGQHVMCKSCWATTPGQDADTRARRGAAIALSKRASKHWTEDNPGARGDARIFRETILPGLATRRLAEIMEACEGMPKSTASYVRAGKQVPALRHWPALERLANGHD